MRIICSIGPKTKNLATLVEMANAGMNAVRFNFSHTDYDEAADLMDGIRTTLPSVQIIADMQGPKLRVSKLFGQEVKVKKGEQIIFCHEDEYEKIPDLPGMLVVPIQFDGNLLNRIGNVETIYMKDATMQFKIAGIMNSMIGTVVLNEGVIRAEKGMNIPGMDRKNLKMTKKDQFDIAWALKHGVDIICLSFVTEVLDIDNYNDYVDSLKLGKFNRPKLWAKVETREGVANFDQILKKVDGIMLGRGDLSAELGVFNIPKAQEYLLAKMKKSPKELIIATYVLETMKQNTMPSVAECCDIYRSLNENVSGFMLTGEVGVGRNPVGAVKALFKMYDDHQQAKMT